MIDEKPQRFVVTIDGPAGSGKSTVARKLANRLGFIHLNSGALFRAVGLEAERVGTELDDDQAISELASQMVFSFELGSSGETVLTVAGEDIGAKLILPKAGKLASYIAVLPKVREVLLKTQRDVVDSYLKVVVEGRDSGTVVFPDADAKFYLDASLAVRAERRFQELSSKADSNTTLDEVTREMADRDYRDSTREIAPQVEPEGAVVVDTSELNVDEVVENLFTKVRSLI